MQFTIRIIQKFLSCNFHIVFAFHSENCRNPFYHPNHLFSLSEGPNYKTLLSLVVLYRNKPLIRKQMEIHWASFILTIEEKYCYVDAMKVTKADCLQNAEGTSEIYFLKSWMTGCFQEIFQFILRLYHILQKWVCTRHNLDTRFRGFLLFTIILLFGNKVTKFRFISVEDTFYELMMYFIRAYTPAIRFFLYDILFLRPLWKNIPSTLVWGMNSSLLPIPIQI